MSEAMRSNEKPSKMKRSAMAVVMAGGLAVSACSNNGEGGALGGGFGASEDEMSVFGNACLNHEEVHGNSIYVPDEMVMSIDNVANGNIGPGGVIRQDIIDAFVEDPNGLVVVPNDLTISKEQRATIGEKMKEMNSHYDIDSPEWGDDDDVYQYYLDKEDTQPYIDAEYLKENTYPPTGIIAYGDKDDATLCVSYGLNHNDILDQQMAARN